MRREAELWLKMAFEDLFDAERMMGDGRYFRVAFFSHQAVEKALKSLFFIVRRENPPHIHSVTELYRLLKERGFELPEEADSSLPILNKYYTVTRYPDAANGLPSECVDEMEAARALKIAKVVVEYVKEQLHT